MNQEMDQSLSGNAIRSIQQTANRGMGKNSSGRSGLQYRLFIVRQGRTLAIFPFNDS